MIHILFHRKWSHRLGDEYYCWTLAIYYMRRRRDIILLIYNQFSRPRCGYDFRYYVLLIIVSITFILIFDATL